MLFVENRNHVMRDLSWLVDMSRAVYRNFAKGRKIWGTYKRGGGGGGEAYMRSYTCWGGGMTQGGENDTRGGKCPPLCHS